MAQLQPGMRAERVATGRLAMNVLSTERSDGEAIYPPQPMVTQTRAVLERYQSRGGGYREVVIANAGHSSHIEQPQRFREAFFAHLRRRQ